jgi:hypothetical protein
MIVASADKTVLRARERGQVWSGCPLYKARVMAIPTSAAIAVVTERYSSAQESEKNQRSQGLYLRLCLLLGAPVKSSVTNSGLEDMIDLTETEQRVLPNHDSSWEWRLFIRAAAWLKGTDGTGLSLLI